MKKTKLVLMLMFVLLVLSGCSAENDKMNFEPDDYYDAEEGGVQDTPEYSSGNDDISDGGHVYQAGETPTLPDRKIIYEASLNVLSLDVEETYQTVLETLGGYTAYIEAESITSKGIDVVIRVYSDDFDELVNDLRNTGDELLTYQKTSEDITNAYSTFEARLEALNAQHARIIELIESATTLADIIELETQRTEIEAELNAIGQTLANYDSLVDYSTINYSIDYIEDLSSLLETSPRPDIDLEDIQKDMIVLSVYNDSDNDTTIYVNVKENGQMIQQYERAVIGEATTEFVIGDLDSGTTYKIEVSSLEENSIRSSEAIITVDTDPTFGSTIQSTFVTSIQALMAVVRGLILAVTGMLPFAVLLGAIGYPVYRYIIKPKQLKRKEKEKNHPTNHKE
jgi:hypothetical protein